MISRCVTTWTAKTRQIVNFSAKNPPKPSVLGGFWPKSPATLAAPRADPALPAKTPPDFRPAAGDPRGPAGNWGVGGEVGGGPKTRFWPFFPKMGENAIFGQKA